MYSVEYLSDLKREQDTERYTRTLYGDNQSDTDVTDISFLMKGMNIMSLNDVLKQWEQAIVEITSLCIVQSVAKRSLLLY